MNGQLLFVYGSMAEGMVHFEKIKDLIVSVVPAVARGTVYRLKIGYPAMVLNGSDFIHGNLVEFKPNEVIWHLLDGFYGYNQQEPSKSLFLRETVNVLANNSMLPTWIYVLPAEKVPINAQVIAGGNWQEALREQPPLSEKLSEKQKNYVLKLGASSGREIIPIDMVLYRELMSLELIVDKGRRLALSRFGQELYRYLK
jgi:gamma-glutamylcyclotransferase (GGCT)/AIG2-like uncharacterized protein YtfP